MDLLRIRRLGEARYPFLRIVFIICMIFAVFSGHQLILIPIEKKGFEFSSALVRNCKNPSHRDHRGISSLDGST